MNLPFLFILNLVLLTRLSLLMKERNRACRFAKWFIEAAVCFAAFEFNSWVFVITAGLFGISLIEFFFERTDSVKTSLRLLALILTIILIGIFAAPWTQLNFRPILASCGSCIQGTALGAVFRGLQWWQFYIILSGILLCLNEASLTVEWVFERLQHSSLVSDDGKNLNSLPFRGGKIIGMLERICIFFLVFSGNFEGIGLIIAAKGLARFKAIEADKELSESFLIGTLISVILSGAVALLTKHLFYNWAVISAL